MSQAAEREIEELLAAHFEYVRQARHGALYRVRGPSGQGFFQRTRAVSGRGSNRHAHENDLRDLRRALRQAGVSFTTATKEEPVSTTPATTPTNGHKPKPPPRPPCTWADDLSPDLLKDWRGERSFNAVAAILGVTGHTVSKWERGDCAPSKPVQQRIRDAIEGKLAAHETAPPPPRVTVAVQRQRQVTESMEAQVDLEQLAALLGWTIKPGDQLEVKDSKSRPLDGPLTVRLKTVRTETVGGGTP